MAVVGAGPAGLAAAWRLAEAGRRVTIYEASSRIGGRLRSEEVAGRGADAVVQLLADGYTRTLALLGAMGLADRVVRTPGRDALWRDGRAHLLRYGSVPSMLTSGALPAALKLRLGFRYVPFLERHAADLDLNEPARAAQAGLDDTSIAEWGREHMGEDFVEMLAYPLLAAYYCVTPEETSAAFFHALARAGMGVDVHGVRGGFGALAADMGRALVERGVEVRTDAVVRSLHAAPGTPPGGVRIALDGGAVEHAGVVLAVPAGPASRLVPGVELVARVRARSSATLVLSTRRPLGTGWFGLSIPRREPGGETLAAVCVQEEKGTGVVGGSGGSLVLVPTPAVGERWAVSGAEVVLKEALAALGQVLPEAPGEVEEGRLIRLEDSAWVPEPGHFERLPAFRPETLPPWLALGGDYMVAPTVEGAVRSGLEAADRLVAMTGAG